MGRYMNCFAGGGKGKLGPEHPPKSLVPLPHLPYLFVMTSAVTSIREQITPILKDRGVLRAGVFGSYARGEESSGSDLDLLVELPPGSSLFDLVGLQLDLSEELGVEVDAHTYRSLHPLLRDRILKEEVQIL
jgi:predicted nucleotidyltransferase